MKAASKKFLVHISTITVILGGLIYTMQNCGREATDAATLQSLDNLAAGRRIHTNFCAASGSELKDPKRTVLQSHIVIDQRISGSTYKDLLTETRAALTAVPPTVQAMFVAAGGSILVTPDAKARCASAVGGRENDSINDSCYILGPIPEEGIQQSLDILVAPTAESIRHNLVRQFGYIYARFLTRLKFNGYTNTGIKYFSLMADVPDSLKADKDALAGAYLADVIDKGVFRLNFPNLKKLSDLKGKARDDAILAMREYVFGEAFDSYYCNNFGAYDANLANAILGHTVDASMLNSLTNTRRLMKDFFPRTFSTFEGIAAKRFGAGVKGSVASSRLNLDDSEDEAAPTPQPEAPQSDSTAEGNQPGGEAPADPEAAVTAQAEVPVATQVATQAQQDKEGIAQLAATSRQTASNNDESNTSISTLAREAGGVTNTSDAAKSAGGEAGAGTNSSAGSGSDLSAADSALGGIGAAVKAGAGSTASTGGKDKGPAFSVSLENYIPETNANGKKVTNPDGFMREPGAIVDPSKLAEFKGDGNRPENKVGTSRLRTDIDVLPDGAAIPRSSSDGSHQRTTSYIGPFQTGTPQVTEKAPVITVNRDLGSGDAAADPTVVKERVQASYPFAIAAPKLTQDIDFKTLPVDANGGRPFTFGGSYAEFPNTQSIITTKDAQGEPQRYNLLEHQTQQSGPGDVIGARPVSLIPNSQGIIRNDRFSTGGTVYPDGRVQVTGSNGQARFLTPLPK